MDKKVKEHPLAPWPTMKTLILGSEESHVLRWEFSMHVLFDSDILVPKRLDDFIKGFQLERLLN